jgi:hypothetical protein
MQQIWDKFPRLKQLGKSITKNDDDAYDLAMEVCLIMLDKPLAPDWYLYTVMRNEWFNKNSNFNKKYGRKDIDAIRFELVSAGEEVNETQFEALRKAPLTELEEKMLACYVECKYNASAVSRKYSISRDVVNRTIYEVKFKLKTEYDRIINSGT